MNGLPAQTKLDDKLCETRSVLHDFRLPDGRPRRILENINLAIGPGEIVALLGPSGCGKSTLLRILAGLISPTHGQVLYHGKPLAGLNPGVGFVFQSFALYPWMTIEQNIAVVLKAAGLEPKTISDRVDLMLDRVGLSAYRDSFPRELSGGMKQRIGIARALSINPEILFMDEPFSQVDSLTAESLRAEVVDIWSDKKRNPSSILMVSHDIKEVVYMADRVVVMSANPGSILKIVENILPRPRDYRSAPFLRLVDQLHEIITGHEMPDVPEVAATTFEPLPNAGPGEIIGLLEYLDARHGQDDLFRIASDTNREFGKMITVAKACEMLGFVDTPKRLVVLSAEGKRFVSLTTPERKDLWRKQLLDLRLFREVRGMLEKQEDKEIAADVVLETIVINMPQENYEEIFDTFIRWGLFGDLFLYDETEEKLRIE